VAGGAPGEGDEERLYEVHHRPRDDDGVEAGDDEGRGRRRLPTALI